jgi:hypothetical protein
LFFGDTEIVENLSAFAVKRLIRHAGNDVKMNVGMFGRFGELDDIGFEATRRFFKRDGNLTEELAEFGGL